MRPVAVLRAAVPAIRPLPYLEKAMKRITTTILATLLAATAQLASAANPIDDSRRHVEVHFADLNLSKIGIRLFSVDTSHAPAMFYKFVCLSAGDRR